MEIYSVAQVTGYLKELIEVDRFLENLWVEGEVSNITRSGAGHLYFTLKDSTSQMRCVMFRGQFQASRSIVPINGTAVIVHGRLSVYETQGVYQLYVDLIQPEGVGALHLEFERLRAQLEREGLFDEARKRPLPKFPRRVGVVTSLSGAVIHDIINVISRRFPSIELVVAPSAVQGQEATDEICESILALNDFGEVDLIILARGGGSLEELWPFNEERVARAIYGSRVPIMAGVGHETDFTIADLVADCRAPTPSAAAELAVPNQFEYAAQVQALERSLSLAAQNLLERRASALQQATSLMERFTPQRLIDQHRQRLDNLTRQAAAQIQRSLEFKQEQLRGHTRQLSALSPLNILARGYSVCLREATGRVVHSVGQVALEDNLLIKVEDGTFKSKVIET